MVTPPNPPRNVTALNIRATSVKIDWDFPLWNGGDANDNFQVSWWVGTTSTGARSWISTFNTDTEKTITNLDVGQTYTFKVTGHNSAGWSQFSDPVVVTLMGGAWIRTSVKKPGGGVTVSWKKAICYVRSGGKWKEAAPYIRDGGAWKQARR